MVYVISDTYKFGKIVRGFEFCSKEEAEKHFSKYLRGVLTGRGIDVKNLNDKEILELYGFIIVELEPIDCVRICIGKTTISVYYDNKRVCSFSNNTKAYNKIFLKIVDCYSKNFTLEHHKAHKFSCTNFEDFSSKLARYMGA